MDGRRWQDNLPSEIAKHFDPASVGHDRVDDEIRLIDAIMASKIADFTKGVDMLWWKEAKKNVNRCLRLSEDLEKSDVPVDQRIKDVKTISNTLREAAEFLDNGKGEEAVLKEVRSLIEDKRKLVESQAKADNLQGKFMGRGTMLAIISALIEITRHRVDNEETLRLIANDVKQRGILDLSGWAD